MLVPRPHVCEFGGLYFSFLNCLIETFRQTWTDLGEVGNFVKELCTSFFQIANLSHRW